MSARNDLLSLLNGLRITVNIGGAAINPARFAAVRTAVQNWSIYVIVNPGLQNNSALRDTLTGRATGRGFDAIYRVSPRFLRKYTLSPLSNNGMHAPRMAQLNPGLRYKSQYNDIILIYI